MCKAPVVKEVGPCVCVWSKYWAHRGWERERIAHGFRNLSHILGTQSQGTSLFIPSSILMALIFPFPSPPATYLMVRPSGSCEHPLECMNCRAHLSLWVGACLSQKEQFLSQAQQLQAAGYQHGRHSSGRISCEARRIVRASLWARIFQIKGRKSDGLGGNTESYRFAIRELLNELHCGPDHR